MRTRVGVADLMARYQFLVDAGKVRQVSQLFTDDAVFQNNGGEAVGPDGVLAFFLDTKDSFIAAGILPARHHLSSVMVDPQEDGSATTYACFQYIGTRGLDHWGTYRDVVVPVESGWKFARRVATVEGCVPASPVVGLLGVEATA
jgi:hypothetical protein